MKTGIVVSLCALAAALAGPKPEMIRTGKGRTKEIYPRLGPELEKVFEEWKKTHPRK